MQEQETFHTFRCVSISRHISLPVDMLWYLSAGMVLPTYVTFHRHFLHLTLSLSSLFAASSIILKIIINLFDAFQETQGQLCESK